MSAFLASITINLARLSNVVLIPAMLYQNLFLLRFPVWYAARFPDPGEQITLNSFANLISSFVNEWKMVIATSAFLLA
jgi:hypothetical protein